MASSKLTKALGTPWPAWGFEKRRLYSVFHRIKIPFFSDAVIGIRFLVEVYHKSLSCGLTAEASEAFSDFQDSHHQQVSLFEYACTSFGTTVALMWKQDLSSFPLHSLLHGSSRPL